MNLELINNLVNNTKKSGFAQNFMKELSNSMENITNKSQKYRDYWKHQNFIEDNLAANLGISRWAANITYNDELSNAINNSILKLSEKEGTLYRKKHGSNGPADNPIYSVDKFENGKIQHLILPANKVPKDSDNEDIIFQINAAGIPQVRPDLKENVIKLATEATKKLKIEENEKASDYKREGHIYEAIEDDGYIFLKDLTEKREYVLEDIDFVVECYQGEGKYQVINNKYEKIN